MPTEDDLRNLFASADAEGGGVDVKRAISRARARRLPRQLAAGAVGGLALTGILVVGIQTSLTPNLSTSTVQGEALAPETAPAAGAANDSAVKRAPAEKINLCGGPLAEVAPSQSGLRLDVAFPATAAIAPGTVTGTVTLVNTTSERITGTTAGAPTVTLSQGGSVLWHSNGAIDLAARIVDLGPGESLEYAASFVPVRCDTADETGDAFRSDLPAVSPGDYGLSAAIDFQPDAPAADGLVSGLELVTGPVTPVRLN